MMEMVQKIVNWLGRYWLTHPAIAIVIQLTVAGWWDILDGPAGFGMWAGAFFAMAYYYGREKAHAEKAAAGGKPIGHSLTNLKFFFFVGWSKDNHMDFWPVVVVTGMLAGMLA